MIWIIPADLCGRVDDLYLKIRDILHTEYMICWYFQYHLSSIVDELFLKRAVSQGQLREITSEDYLSSVKGNSSRRVV